MGKPLLRVNTATTYTRYSTLPTEVKDSERPTKETWYFMNQRKRKDSLRVSRFATLRYCNYPQGRARFQFSRSRTCDKHCLPSHGLPTTGGLRVTILRKPNAP